MPTRPDLIFGVNNRTKAPIGNTSSNLGVVAYEEQSTANNGFGQRMAVRHYENLATAAWLSGSDILTKFNGGRPVVVSISGSYMFGSNDAGWNALFDRMYALDFGGTDTSGAGTKKPLSAPICLYHEVDVPAHNVDPAAYVTAWKHIRTLRNARAAAAGKDPLRVPMMTIFTAYSVNIGRATPYWPGNDQVDLFGVDGYSGLNGGPWTEPASIFGGSLTFAASHGDKDIWICETSVKAETGHDVGAWWNNFATLVAAKPKIKAVLAFQGAPGDTVVNFDKVGNPAKHAGMAAFITTTGATAGYGTGSTPTTLVPAQPTGLGLASTSDGTGLTVTKGAAPSGSSLPTSYDVYIAPGNVTSGFVKVNPTPLAYAASFSYTITGLTPGTTYTVTMAAANSAGRSGFGEMKPAATAVPGSNNHAPVITAGATSVDPADPNTITVAVTGFDPEGNPLTYTHQITGPQGFALTLTGATVSHTFDQPGAYMDVVTVSDGTDTTQLTLRFAVSAGEGSTEHFNWAMPQPGDDLRNLPVLLRQIFPDIDSKLWTTTNGRSGWNLMHGYAASTFDPQLASTSKTAAAAGDLRWYKMVVQDTQVTGISTWVTDVQTGSGTVLCIHAADGSPLCGPQSGTAVDIPLQTVGDTSIVLDTPITGLISGSVIYLGWWTPASGVTPAKTYIATANSVMASAHLTAGTYRGNLLAAQSGYPDALPVGSGSTVAAAFWALY